MDFVSYHHTRSVPILVFVGDTSLAKHIGYACTNVLHWRDENSYVPLYTVVPHRKMVPTLT